MARIHVEEEAEDSDSLPEILSVLSLTGDAIKPRTATSTRSKGETSKVTTTAKTITDSEALKRRHKGISLSLEDTESRGRTTSKIRSRRPLATIPDNPSVQRGSQSHVSPARRAKKANRHPCSKFIAFEEDYESDGSEDDSIGSLADFIVDDDYFSYESGNERENTNSPYEGIGGPDNTKGKEKWFDKREQNPRDQSRRPLVPIPDNCFVPKKKPRVSWDPRVEKPSQLPCSNPVPSESEDDYGGSEEESPGSLVDFVVDDDYISYESEGGQENTNPRCKGRDSHGTNISETNRCSSARSALTEQWNNDKNFDSSASDSAVSDEPGGISKNAPTGALGCSQPIYEAPVLPPKKISYITILSSPSPKASKLTSPRKQLRIPTPCLRPSEDAFWNSDFINKWNDHHSPEKTPNLKASGKMNTTDEYRHEEISQDTSHPKTPSKKSRAELESKRSFSMRKDDIARAFLAELDDKLASGRISDLTASSGGVQIVWSKTLRTTAGRARARPYRVQRDNFPGQTFTDGYWAKIELSEKILDNEGRLYDTLAHEWSHIAHIIISGGKGKPHGREFMQWSYKTLEAFPNRVITVSAKHRYDIDYKFIWKCSGCGVLYKRHSGSIDPAKQVCKPCRGRLIQIKPTPRTGPSSTWQLYLKQHLKGFKKANPGKSHHEVMQLLAAAYREAQRAAASDGTQAVAQSSSIPNEIISLISDDEEEGDVTQDGEVEAVDDEEEDEDKRYPQAYEDAECSEVEDGEVEDEKQEYVNEDEDGFIGTSQLSPQDLEYPGIQTPGRRRQRRNAVVHVLPESLI